MWIVVAVFALLFVLAYLIAGRALDSDDHGHYDEPGHELEKPPEQISVAHDDVVDKLARYHRDGPGPTDVGAQRRHFEELFAREVDAEIRPADVQGIPGEWVLAEGARPEQRLLYLHGGAFRIGSPKTHRGLTSELSRRAGVAVLAVDYRMLPEHRLIHCHEDARAAYGWMLENGPQGASHPEGLYVAGDSAGGNLTLSLLAWIRDGGLRAPHAAIALAPGTDSTFGSPSWRTNRETDPFLGPSLGRIMRLPRSLLLVAGSLLNRTRPNDPAISPLLGDLSGLAPTLIQVSEQEMLFDDGRRYANKARAAGSHVTLQVWPRLVHVFQGFHPELPEAHDALDSIAAFIRAHMPATESDRPELRAVR